MKLTSAKITKMFKLEIAIFEVSPKLYSFFGDLEKYPHALEAEAKMVADRLMGTYDWQGMQSEWKHFSGLKKLVNANMKNGWKATEKPLGNGYSIYYLG